MTVNFTPREMEVLERLAAEKDLSQEAVLRQALRLYQMVDVRLSRGERMWPDEPPKSAGVVVCPDRVREAYERYLRDGTDYTHVLVEESVRARKELAAAVNRRAREMREER